MSALDDIEAAAGALNNLTAQEAAQKAAIDAAVAAALAAMIAPSRAVYVDAVAGLDTNDGSAPAKAFATLNRALAAFSAGQIGTIKLLSDVVVTSYLDVVGDVNIQSDTTQYDGSVTGTVRTITFAASAYKTFLTNTYASGHAAGGTLSFGGVNIHFPAVTTATASFGVSRNVVMGNVGLSWDAGMTSPVFFIGSACTVYLINCRLQSDYPGKLFAGVAAGQNPNSGALRTNITSA